MTSRESNTALKTFPVLIKRLIITKRKYFSTLLNCYQNAAGHAYSEPYARHTSHLARTRP